MGTADDVRQTLNNFQRQITISPVFLTGTTTINNNLRLITVTVRYTVPQFGGRQYQVSAYISKYR